MWCYINYYVLFRPETSVSLQSRKALLNAGHLSRDDFQENQQER